MKTVYFLETKENRWGNDENACYTSRARAYAAYKKGGSVGDYTLQAATVSERTYKKAKQNDVEV